MKPFVRTSTITSLAAILALLTPALGLAVDDLAEFDAYAAAAVADWEVPGLAITVVKDGEVAFAKGYGVTSLDGGTAVDEHTLFSIGSTTKAFAAAAIGLLVDAGRLEWDSKLSEILPEFRLSDPVVTETMRVRDLLTHNLGVPNTDLLWYEQPASLDEILAKMRFAPKESAAYSNFTYQNVMYAAAGKVVEVVSGMPWSQFVEERLFTPLGMSRSVATLARLDERRNVATPHDRVEGQIRPIENASVDSVAAAGSIWSSVHEMGLWARFLLRGCKTESGDALLEDSTCSELFEPQTIVNREMYPAMRLYDHKWFTYGLGWFQTDYNGRALDFHSGSIDGLVALIGLVRKENLGVYVLGNLDHAEVRHALMYRALDLFDERVRASERRDWNREILDLFAQLEREAQEAREQFENPPLDPRPPLGLETYVGSFEHELGGTIEVSLEDEMLSLRWGHRTCFLQTLGADRFRCAWSAQWRGGLDVEFLRRSLRIGGLEFSRR